MNVYKCLHFVLLCVFLFYLDGNFLAIGSHDNYIYIYAVAENGRKYSRVGKCSVSTCIYAPPLPYFQGFFIFSSFPTSTLYLVASSPLYLGLGSVHFVLTLC